MKRSLSKVLARMAKDGDIETVAGIIEEMLDPEAPDEAPEAPETADVQEEQPAEETETKNIIIDEDSLGGVLERLDRIIALLAPAAADATPEEAEPVAEKLEERGFLFDVVTSNPPYFRHSLKSPSETRNMARHADTLPFDELAKAVTALLTPDGTFTAILPCPEADDFIATAKEQNLFCQKEILVFSKQQGTPLRKVFVLGRKNAATPAVSQLAIYDSTDGYSEQYRSLTADLYLWEK